MRGRLVFLSVATIAQAALIAIDYQVHAILLAALETIPILIWALCANYRAALAFATVTAIFASVYETPPEPQSPLNPSVWLNAAIFWVGYAIALGLLRLVRELGGRTRAFLTDFNELKAAYDELLPATLPPSADWEFSVLKIGRRDVGGLFYDLAKTHTGIDLFASTVSGSPIRASLIVSALKGLWPGGGALPAASLRTLNRRVQSMLRGETVIGAWYGKLYDNGVVRYASAGFPAPFLVGPDGAVRRLGGGGAPLGDDVRVDVAEAVYMLDAGTSLIVANDGVCELIERGVIDQADLLSDLEDVREYLSTIPRERDLLAVVARRKTTFLFRRRSEEPSLPGSPPRPQG
jgi:hypothetical protein